MFRIVGFCMYSLAEPCLSSGLLDFACSALQGLGNQQDAWVLHVQLGRALVNFGIVGFCIVYVQDAGIWHVQLSRALVFFRMLRFCMYSLAEHWLSSEWFDFG